MTEFKLIRGRLSILADILEANQSAKPARELEGIVRELERSLQPTNPRGSKGSPEYLFSVEQRGQIRDAHQRLMVAVRHRNPDGQTILEALQDALSHWPATK